MAGARAHLAGAAAVLVLAAGCGGGRPAVERFPDASVVLIGVDTLRADHLGCYGYPRPTSPRIDALCRESVVFEWAISQSPWTLPAFASIFTGVVPSSHRAGEVGRHPPSRRSIAPWVALLDGRYDTLAALLRRAGWRTGSFVSSHLLGPDFGLTQGFDAVHVAAAPEEALERGLAWLEAQAGGRFFLFLHLMDPHAPYTPSAEDAAPFVDPTYRGPIELRWPVNGRHVADTTGDRRRVIDLYDGEVRSTDRLVGRLLDALDAAGASERTLVVLVSDHGEGLFQHGLVDHGTNLHDELLHVPLVVRFPRPTHRRVAHQVRTMDVFPTVLDALALAVPPRLDGVSLLGLAGGRAREPATATAFSEFLTKGEQKSIREPHRKLIFTPATGGTLLFDLAADPGEERDLAPREPQAVRRLRAMLEPFLCRSFEGFELRLAGGRTPRRVRAKLRTPSRFEEVAVVGGAAGDGRRPAAGRRLLDVAFELSAAGAAADKDGVRFRTADDAPVEVRVSVDGRPLPRSRLAVGLEEGRPPAAGAVAAGDALVPASCPGPLGPAPDGEVRAHLAFIRRTELPPASIDAKTRAQLEALGCIE